MLQPKATGIHEAYGATERGNVIQTVLRVGPQDQKERGVLYSVGPKADGATGRHVSVACRIAQLVEQQRAKLSAAGSNPVSATQKAKPVPATL